MNTKFLKPKPLPNTSHKNKTNLQYYPLINWLHYHRRATIHPVLACILTMIWSVIGGFAYGFVSFIPFPNTELGHGWLFYTGPLLQFLAQLLLLWLWWRVWVWLRYKKQHTTLPAQKMNHQGVPRSLSDHASTNTYLDIPRIHFFQRIGISPLARRPHQRWRLFCLGAALGVVSVSIPLWLLLFVYGTDAITLSVNTLSASWWLLLVFSLALFLFQSGVEEVINRGFLLPEIASRWGITAGVLLNSGLFVLFHLSNPDLGWVPLLNIFFAGVLFSLLYLRFNSLWVSIGFHGLWNWTQASFYGFAVSGITMPVSILQAAVNPNQPDWLTGGSFGLEGSVLTCFVLLGVIAWLILSIRRRRQAIVSA